MPIPPKKAWVRNKIWEKKVRHQPETKKTSHTNGDGGIPGKIAIDLEGKRVTAD
ncbi:hypothetical protein DSCO28_33420 [Desulfosarcina ovata subsp. sediminis]|uniref:Uncharacterized protein n=1 Tax=Desulfosarcina ovata subsp. sediminis TaxID=885957 RepID=A0A5K7ZN71_9BACT|nr:hypothetical protein DSCO28_33420 [Desulfosarcina ovata subsp. sediminis]